MAALKVNGNSGWVEGIACFPSPNHKPRVHTALEQIDLIVLHCVSLPAGEYIPKDIPFVESTIHQMFMRQNIAAIQARFPEETITDQLSCHFFIPRHHPMCQYVALKEQAFHAGASEFAGRSDCNEFSIGIELEGYWHDDSGYTDSQYEQLKSLIVALRNALPGLNRDRIKAHSDIAEPKGRKEDPGRYFDWQMLLNHF